MEALLSGPLVRAVRDETNRALPDDRGLYSWWAPRGLFEGFRYGPEGPLTRDAGRLELLYVGIAGATSSVTVRQRVRENHLGAQTGSSTFRRALGAWLGEEQGWERRQASDRVALTVEAERDMTTWMGRHLCVCGVAHDAPGAVEAAVIGRLAPPLNHAHSGGAPNFAQLEAARSRWRRFP